MADGHGRAGLDAHLVQYNRTAKNLFFKSRRIPMKCKPDVFNAAAFFQLNKVAKRMGGRATHKFPH
jgi:hypothetical protein